MVMTCMRPLVPRAMVIALDSVVESKRPELAESELQSCVHTSKPARDIQRDTRLPCPRWRYYGACLQTHPPLVTIPLLLVLAAAAAATLTHMLETSHPST